MRYNNTKRNVSRSIPVGLIVRGRRQTPPAAVRIEKKILSRVQNVIKAWRLSMLKASEESPSDRVKLTVTHFISMALKALLPPSEEFRRVERPTDIAALLRASSLPSFPSESLFLLVAGITLHPLAKVNQSNEAVLCLEPRFFLKKAAA